MNARYYADDGEALIPAVDVATLLGVTVGTLRVMRHRRPDWLPVERRGPHGVALFRHAAVVQSVVLAA